VRFDFNLARDAPGWADPVIECGDQRLKMTASYLSDALGDLLDAVLLLATGSVFAECAWTEEPGGWLWTFGRPNESDVEVEVEFQPDVFAPVGWQPRGSGESRFHCTATLVELATATAVGARRCLEEFGLDGYAQQWVEHPFPRQQLAALQRWLDDGGKAPRPETA
jgi:hypothetical protein